MKLAAHGPDVSHAGQAHPHFSEWGKSRDTSCDDVMTCLTPRSIVKKEDNLRGPSSVPLNCFIFQASIDFNNDFWD